MENSKKKIIVLGDSCEDLFFKVERMPLLGETLDTHGSYKSYGGKGANSALAIGKLGYDIEFLTQVGSDLQGRELIEELKEMKVGTQYIKTLDKVNTGLGFILQLKTGDNVVISVGGANTAYDPNMTTLYPDWVTAIQNANMICLQRLIPDYVNLVAAKIAKEAGVTVILDVGGMSSNVLPELYQMLGRKYDNNYLEEELHQFLKQYSHLKLLLKQGETGATLTYLKDQQVDGEVIKIFSPSYKFADFEHLNLHLTDTAGAGDCFTGAFAAKLSEFHKDDKHNEIETYTKCLQFGNRVGFLCVSKAGTMSSVPSIQEVERVFGKDI
eukprot:403376739